MRIRIKACDFNVDAALNMELLVNMEDFYKMLDSINPHILTDYIYMRLKHKQ